MSALNCAIKVGAATTMARCDAPSITRLSNIQGNAGTLACTSDTAAPAQSAANKARRYLMRATTRPATTPNRMPTNPTSDTIQPTAAPACG